MIKVAIIGPESTGKSTLTKALALFFGVPSVMEYAREYVEQLNRPYTFEDVCAIAQRQIEEEKYYLKNSEVANIVFFDTDLIITKVWFSFCYNTVPDFVSKQLNTGYFDVYLLCAPDLEWIPDKVREHGNDREYFFSRYQQEIEQLHKPFVVIRGEGDERLLQAIVACQQVLENRITN